MLHTYFSALLRSPRVIEINKIITPSACHSDTLSRYLNMQRRIPIVFNCSCRRNGRWVSPIPIYTQHFRYIIRFVPSFLSWRTIVFLRPLLQKGSFSGEPFPNKNDLTDPDEQEHHSFHHRALHHAPMVVFCGCGDGRGISANTEYRISIAARQKWERIRCIVSGDK